MIVAYEGSNRLEPIVLRSKLAVRLLTWAWEGINSSGGVGRQAHCKRAGQFTREFLPRTEYDA